MSEIQAWQERVGWRGSTTGLSHVEKAMMAEIADLRSALDKARKAEARYEYVRTTTTAIRNTDTGERIECTPEQFDAAVDAAVSKAAP